MKLSHKFFAVCICVLFCYGCATTSTTYSPIKRPVPESRVDTINFEKLKNPPKNWEHLDQAFTGFPGISSKLAYKYILSKREPKQQVIVAVIDNGLELDTKDLQGNIWTNKDEIPHNGEDDDHNGYVDDVHGWNFIGGPKGNVIYDTQQITRIYARLKPKFENVDTTALTAKQQKKYQLFKEIKKQYKFKINQMLKRYKNISRLQQRMMMADSLLTRHFDGPYILDMLQKYQPAGRRMAFAKRVMSYTMKNDIDSALIAKRKKALYHNAKYDYNPNYSPRYLVDDNYQNKTEHYYGNNEVGAVGPYHGTHVAGIIAAVRYNDIGLKGIADSVLIMPVRVVPDGDERDKDVANGIRYAVNNGADIINMSFGKRYSPHRKVVDQAIIYADKHGVLMVHAAGNASANMDKHPTYPTDRFIDLPKGVPNLWISVGATSWRPDSSFVASFSNYGNKTVDLFAPGVGIYSTVLQNNYERASGTSMAAPVVSAVAAVVMEYFPKLTAAQVKMILMKSSKKYPGKIVVYPHKPGEEGKVGLFSKLSVSGGVVNLFNALQMAQKVSTSSN